MGKYPWVMVVVLLMGCHMYIGAKGIDTYDTVTVNSTDEAMGWIRANITYCTDKAQYGVADYWATPSETLASGKGDCEDMAMLYLWIVYNSLGKEGELVLLGCDDPYKGHAEGQVLGTRFYVVEGYDKEYDRIPMNELKFYFGKNRSMDSDNSIIVD